MKTQYECPKCYNILYGELGEDVMCNNCNVTYKTDFDYITEDSLYSWIVEEKQND